MRTRTLLMLASPLLFALTSFAQSNAEFGRASGGAIEMVTKTPRQFSGSFSLSQSTGAFRGRRYEGSLGGALLNDRVWFFAAASVLPQVQFSTPQLSAIDAKATAQPVDWTTMTASFRRSDQPLLATGPNLNSGSLPSSFLSLHSTSMLSDRMMLDFHVTQRTATRPAFALTPAAQ